MTATINTHPLTADAKRVTPFTGARWIRGRAAMLPNAFTLAQRCMR